MLEHSSGVLARCFLHGVLELCFGMVFVLWCFFSMVFSSGVLGMVF